MNKGRYTVLPSEPITLFLIGLRVNKWYKIHKWLPVLLAMPPMLNELLKNKSLGCLSYEMLFKYRGVMIVQYWESNEQLLFYSKCQST
ncbi:monooxygenase family protein [Staphylococcus xylosus]|uniref:monooxygenase family protein n=1 Tax=Staphylococcus xylosus TaxID=1288 RepID=UPI003F549C20